jgi:gamma-glutamyl:cysteine ligase YbdK (ATP-grasp superfamily)
LAEHEVFDCRDEVRRRAGTLALLEDLRTLEAMLARGGFDEARRIGAEQEMFLVDAAMRPASIAVELLESLHDPRFTTEIARFNLEANLPPAFVGPGMLDGLRSALQDVVSTASRAARERRARVVLTGILPTLSVSDLKLENLSPNPRYRALNDTLLAMRGEPFHVRIEGMDHFDMRHENVLFEACTTSFQLHLQVTPESFAPLYNLAQAISAPLLAVAANSPLLMGHRLWRETRIPLFDRATDPRSEVERRRRQPSRVRFGDRWIERSILELYHEDAARYPIVVLPPNVRDEGIPRLRSLCAHTGTVWRWNRGCYGVTEGRPHLRIENRVVPAGPTVVDEVANAALFYGLMSELPYAYGRIESRLAFDDAERNFFAAARDGLLSQLVWIDGARVKAIDLLLHELVPLARRGLARLGLEQAEIERHLGVIEERVRSAQTGAQWTLASYAALGEANRERRDRSLVAGMIERQESGDPVHRWTVLGPADLRGRSHDAMLERLMHTDAITVRPDDPIDLANSVMAWNDLPCVPVEDERGMLVGVIARTDRDRSEPVRTAITKAVTAQPDASREEAARILAETHAPIICVENEGRLLGVVHASEITR